MKYPVMVVAALACFTGCGYHVQGHDDLLPKTLHIIYVPAWTNSTVRYKLTDTLPQDIAREFIARTRYEIVTKPDNADAILTGTVVKYAASPAIFDPATARASVVEFEVAMSVKLTDKTTGKILWENSYLTFKQRYEISTTPTAYFDESGPALTRLSREAARSIVSAILSNF
jgi:hypothetical protein